MFIALILSFMISSAIQISTAEASDVSLKAGTISSFDPLNLFKYRPWNGVNYAGFTHIGLVRYDEHLNVLPCLARDWKISDDGKSITFKLADNATWHDGTPVTAEDVKFTFDYNKKHGLPIAYLYNNYYDHVSALDTHEVTLYSTEPVGAALLTSLQSAYIIPKHIWEKVEDPEKYEGKDGMIGCGPFVFESYDQVATEANFRANADFFLGKPTIDSVNYQYYRTIDSMLLALKKGDIDTTFDYYMPVPAVYAASLADAKDVELGSVPDVGVLLNLEFGYNQFLKMMNESQFKKFREAVAYAVDYQQIVDMISAGYGEVPGRGYVPPTAIGYDPDIPKLEHNLAKAEGILDSLGFIDTNGNGVRNLPDGSELSFTITPPVWKQDNMRAAEVICSHLQKAGLDAQIDGESLSNEDKCHQRIFKDRDYYMCIYYSTPYSIMYDAGGVNCANMTGSDGTCSDPRLIDLLERVRYSNTLEQRSEAVRALQQYYSEELPFIALDWANVLYPYRTDRFGGWKIQDGYGNMNFDTWFSLKPEA
ncbi:MAG TPA: ABC transporter substrate-binding protein [Methanotrichaceae archaeon]|nr:ABC transporter substrate-binding protein [Methanotrichaceae archaeon]